MNALPRPEASRQVGHGAVTMAPQGAGTLCVQCRITCGQTPPNSVLLTQKACLLHLDKLLKMRVLDKAYQCIS